MAAYVQSSLHVEIQNLKEALSASRRKSDRYAQMIATLTVELDDLRNNICHSCKTRLTSGNTFVPSVTILADQGSPTDMAASVSASQGRPRSHLSTDNALSIGLSRSPAALPNTNNSLCVPSEPEVTRNLNSSRTTSTSSHPGRSENIISPEQTPKPPQWSVVYHPEVKQALELHLAHAFKYDSSIYRVNMSPDGQRLAVGLLGNGKTYLNELENGSNICVFVDRYVKDLINILSVQFSPNGRFLATGANDTQIRIWDITTKRMRVMFIGHKAVSSLAFSPNGRFLVSASASVRKWNIRDGSSKVLPVTRPPRSFTSVAFSPDGRYVAAGNYDRSLWIWDSRTHRLVAKWLGHARSVSCIEFTPDGKGLLSGGLDKTIKYWDVSLLGNRQGVSTGPIVNEEQGFPLVRNFLGHKGSVSSIAFFPDNAQWMVTGSHDKNVRVWDIESGVCLLTLEGHMDWVRGVDVSRTQNFLATAGEDRHVAVWKYKLL